MSDKTEHDDSSDDETGVNNIFSFTDAVPLIDSALEKAGRNLLIKTHTMNHPIFGNEQFVETLKNKLVSSQRFVCQILVEDAKPSKSNSDFVRLYQRLTDYIEIRIFKPEHANSDRRQFIIIDDEFLAWQSYDRRHDMRIYSDRHRIEDFTTAFEADWRTSSRELSLLKLYI